MSHSSGAWGDLADDADTGSFRLAISSPPGTAKAHSMSDVGHGSVKPNAVIVVRRDDSVMSEAERTRRAAHLQAEARKQLDRERQLREQEASALAERERAALLGSSGPGSSPSFPGGYLGGSSSRPATTNTAGKWRRGVGLGRASGVAMPLPSSRHVPVNRHTRRADSFDNSDADKDVFKVSLGSHSGSATTETKAADSPSAPEPKAEPVNAVPEPVEPEVAPEKPENVWARRREAVQAHYHGLASKNGPSRRPVPAQPKQQPVHHRLPAREPLPEASPVDLEECRRRRREERAARGPRTKGVLYTRLHDGRIVDADHPPTSPLHAAVKEETIPTQRPPPVAVKVPTAADRSGPPPLPPMSLGASARVDDVVDDDDDDVATAAVRAATRAAAEHAHAEQNGRLEPHGHGMSPLLGGRPGPVNHPVDWLPSPFSESLWTGPASASQEWPQLLDAHASGLDTARLVPDLSIGDTPLALPPQQARPAIALGVVGEASHPTAGPQGIGGRALWEPTDSARHAVSSRPPRKHTEGEHSHKKRDPDTVSSKPARQRSQPGDSPSTEERAPKRGPRGPNPPREGGKRKHKEEAAAPPPLPVDVPARHGKPRPTKNDTDASTTTSASRRDGHRGGPKGSGKKKQGGPPPATSEGVAPPPLPVDVPARHGKPRPTKNDTDASTTTSASRRDGHRGGPKGSGKKKQGGPPPATSEGSAPSAPTAAPREAGGGPPRGEGDRPTPRRSKGKRPDGAAKPAPGKDLAPPSDGKHHGRARRPGGE
jgi:hypothetical protein